MFWASSSCFFGMPPSGFFRKLSFIFSGHLRRRLSNRSQSLTCFRGFNKETSSLSLKKSEPDEEFELFNILRNFRVRSRLLFELARGISEFAVVLPNFFSWSALKLISLMISSFTGICSRLWELKGS